MRPETMCEREAVLLHFRKSSMGSLPSSSQVRLRTAREQEAIFDYLILCPAL